MESVSISWSAGVLNDCNFAYWQIDVSQCSTIESAVCEGSVNLLDQLGVNALQSASYAQRSMTIQGLEENTPYAFKVAARCQDTRADSTMSTADHRNPFAILIQLEVGEIV